MEKNRRFFLIVTYVANMQAQNCGIVVVESKTWTLKLALKSR